MINKTIGNIIYKCSMNTAFCLGIFLFIFMFIAQPALAAVNDLKLTGKTTGSNFVAGNVKYKNTNVTAVEYKPSGKTKPVTALIFDTFSLADYVTDDVEKALLLDFEFKGAALIAVPEGSGVTNVKAKDLPAPLVEALGGPNSPLFPLDLSSGVNFASSAGLKSGSITDVLVNSMGVKKTTHVVKGKLSANFLDITGIVLPSINLSFPDLLAMLNLNFSIPDLIPDFFVPFEFANSKFNISRERDVFGKATGVLVGYIHSDIAVNTPGMGKTYFPAVRIGGSLDTGISFRSFNGINWPKLFDLPWVSLTDLKLDAKAVRGSILNKPNLTLNMTAKGRVNNTKNIPVEATLVVEGRNIGDVDFRLPNFDIDLGKIPGLKDIPGVNGVKLTNPVISPTAIGGKLTVDKLKINKADVLFFKTSKSSGWSFATLRDNFTAASIVSELKGTVVENAKIENAALIISKPGYTGKVGDLPKKVRKWLKNALPDDEMRLALASGVNVVGTFNTGSTGEIGKLLKGLGAPDKLVMSGGFTGVFDSKPKSFKASGGFPKISMPDLGFFKIPQPKNAPALFMEFVNNQPAIGVEVEETFPIKDGNRSIDFNSKLAFTVSPTGGTSISMTGASIKNWPNPFGIKGLTLKPGTSLSVAGGVVGPQISVNGIADIGSKEITIGGTIASAGAAFRGSIDSIGIYDVAILAASIAESNGNKLDVSGLPAADLKNVDIAFASPGISIPDLNISGGGTRMNGDLYFIDPKKNLGRVDVNFDATGMAINSELGEIGVGPLVLKKNTLDMALKTTAPPRFAIESESTVLGVTTKMLVNAGPQNLDLTSTQQFGDVFAYGFNASTGNTIDWANFDPSKADLRLATTLKSDPGKWFRENASAVVKDAFDSLKPGFNDAVNDIEKAQAEVDKLDREIAKQREIVKAEKEPSVNRLKDAEAEVATLQNQINGFNRDISTFKGRIKTCNQSYSICTKYGLSGGGCKKKKSTIFGKVCVEWHPVRTVCKSRSSVPDVAKRAVCEANNTQPRAELAWAESKKAGVVAAKVTAEETVKLIRQGVEAFPIDLDPRVAGPIAAKEIAKGVLEAAKQTVSGIGNFSELLAAGVNAVGSADAFAIENSVIRGSLNGGLRGKPVVLDLKFRVAGTQFANRFGFSLTDWKYNAKQFEVIAIGAAVRAVVKEARKSGVVPHVLLDRVNELYLTRQAAADAIAARAAEDNGGIETNPDDANLSMAKKIDLDNRNRRAEQEKARADKIASMEEIRDSANKERTAQLDKLLSGANMWKKMPGSALDIGAGANGSVWVVGADRTPFSWNGNGWKKMPGAGVVRIDVGPKGDAWIVNANGQIYNWTGTKWNLNDGGATDIAVGANGKVWVIGSGKEAGGYGIYHRTNNKWVKVPGSALRIDVDGDGNAWVVNNANSIFRYNGKSWDVMPGRALDIAVSSNGTVMVIGTDRTPWVWDGKTWQKLPGSALTGLTLDGDGNPLGVNTNKQIWAWGDAAKPSVAKMENISDAKVKQLVANQINAQKGQIKKLTEFRLRGDNQLKGDKM